jgi:hypothetical protein
MIGERLSRDPEARRHAALTLHTEPKVNPGESGHALYVHVRLISDHGAWSAINPMPRPLQKPPRGLKRRRQVPSQDRADAGPSSQHGSRNIPAQCACSNVTLKLRRRLRRLADEPLRSAKSVCRLRSGESVARDAGPHLIPEDENDRAFDTAVLLRSTISCRANKLIQQIPISSTIRIINAAIVLLQRCSRSNPGSAAAI